MKVLLAAPRRVEGFTLELPLAEVSPPDETRDRAGGGPSRVSLHSQGASGPAEAPGTVSAAGSSWTQWGSGDTVLVPLSASPQ